MSAEFWCNKAPCVHSPFPQLAPGSYKGLSSEVGLKKGTFSPTVVVNLCTPSGSFYSTMISSMCTSMEWFCVVMMELNDASIQGSSHTLQTTRKSELFVILFFFFFFTPFTYLLGFYLQQFETKAFVRAHVVWYPNQTLVDSDLNQIARIALRTPASTKHVVLLWPGKLSTS